MSDYLSNLAAKSLDVAATIRPRLASFYEPPRQYGFALPPEPPEQSAEQLFDGTVDAAGLRTEPRSEPARIPLPATTPRLATEHGNAAPVVSVVVPERVAQSPQLQTATTDHASSAAVPETAPAQPTSKPLQPMPAQMQPRPFAPTAENVPVENVPVGERRMETRRETPGPVVETEVTSALVTPPANRVETTVPSPRVVAAGPLVEDRTLPARRIETPAAVATEPARPQRANEPSAPLQAQTATSHAIVTDRVTPPSVKAPEAGSRQAPGRVIAPEPSPSNRMTPSGRLVVEPRVVPRMPAPERLRAQRERESAPDIQVTIGRVEVRAVQAAEPPSRSRPAPPSSFTSLDDYLSRRGAKR